MRGGGGVRDLSAGGDETPSRPDHVISSGEVESWLAHSVNKVVTYHRTSRLAAQEILARGVDVARSRIGAFGRGFYTSTVSDPFFGETELAVAIRARRPLVGELDDLDTEMEALTKELSGGTGRLTPPVAAAIRQELLRRGYDSIIVRNGGGDGIDYVIALGEETVKVVQS